jgi:Uma2 family endonuclease
MTLQALKFVRQGSAPVSAKKRLPTMYDLPSENPEDPGMPDQYHIWQSDLLTRTFRPPDYPEERILVASDLNLYYDPKNTSWYKRPDWYAVLDVPHLYANHDPRLSFVVWDEKAVPYIAVELLSPGTEKEDTGKSRRKSGEPPTKWEVYEKILGIPYYVLFDRHNKDRLIAYRLARGQYRRIALPKKRLWLPEIKLGLGLKTGIYHNLKRRWLRWYDAENRWIPTPEEEKEQAEKEKQQAEQRAEKEKRQAEQRAERERSRAEKEKRQIEKEKRQAEQRAESERSRAEKEKQRAEKEKQQKELIRKEFEKERERTDRLLAMLRAAGIEPDV